jgi:pyridoxal phosphate-dependent aminotransferase EpsN
MAKVHLSPPEVGDRERELLLAAFDSGWIAPLGPDVDAFEAELAAAVGVGHGAAVASGTAALHLALELVGVGPGDEVVTSTLTFAATANAVCYLGARPVFVDVDPLSWQLDPTLLAETIERRAGEGRPPGAIVTVDLYGQCADADAITRVADAHGIPVIEDAAEALGATYKERRAGALGRIGVVSFNGNKIVTTSGGGMLLADDGELVERARFLASQARDPAPHYEHSAVGYNYRLSNLLAAVGRAQLASLDEKVARRRAINARYREGLGDLPGVGFMPQAPYGEPTWWLSCLTVDAGTFGAAPEDLRQALAADDIEARPVWKPLHRQPAFAGCEVVGGEVADGLFARGLCLPSGSGLSEGEQDRVIEIVRAQAR